MKMTVALHNLGCKVNAYELEAMRQQLETHGYEVVPFVPGADIYIINTCTVTNIADRKSRQMLHKAKKMNPCAIVVAAGCYVQARGAEVEQDQSIDIVIGNNKKQDLISILEKYRCARGINQEDSGMDMHMIDISHTCLYEPLSISRTAERTRAYIKVQDGCSQFCSYCIIPYARGRVRSREKGNIVEEVRRLAQGGCREVVLTGIHLSSYGADFPAKSEESLLTLVRAVHQVEGVSRIRLGSLEPRIVTDSFVRGIVALPKICPHFHLSLQSGCDGTLKRMNRRYTAEEYRKGCEMLREYYDNPALTTDVIVGFPGETEEEFEASRAFVEEMRFFETHIFKYSRRKGTKASAMKGQISEQVKHERSRILKELDVRRRSAYMQTLLNHPAKVLMEGQIMVENVRYWVGHTPEYVRVGMRSTECLQNCIVAVTPVREYADKPSMILAGSELPSEKGVHDKL